MMILNNCKTEVIRFGFFILFTNFIFFSCDKNPLTAQDIIERSIETHGGLQTWKEVKQLSFNKKTTLFLEDGTVELKTDQFQLFRFGEKLFGQIEWESDSNNFKIIYSDNKVSKKINDSIITDKEELKKAESSFWAAHYVVCKPFDLIGDHIELSLGEDIQVNNKPHYQILVKYDSDTSDSDQWSYIIEKETFKVVANKVILKDHTSWVENLTYNNSTDLLFNAHRKSFRMNENGEKTYLRAEYFYSDYKIEK